MIQSKLDHFSNSQTKNLSLNCNKIERDKEKEGWEKRNKKADKETESSGNEKSKKERNRAKKHRKEIIKKVKEERISTASIRWILIQLQREKRRKMERANFVAYSLSNTL